MQAQPALATYVTLMRSAQSIERVAAAHARAHGLSLPQFGILEALYHRGTMHQHTLAEKLLCTPGNITTVLSNLERAGLIERRAEARDRRCTLVALSKRGRTLIKRIFPEHAAEIAQIFAALSPSELEQLRVFCRAVGRRAAGLPI